MGYLLFTSIIIYILGIFAIISLPKKLSAIITATSGFLGSVMLLIFASYSLFSKTTFTSLLWSIPNIGNLTISVDHLSAFFLIATAIVAIPTSIFTATRIAYIKRYNNSIFLMIYLCLLISIVMVLVSYNLFLFLLSWEIMSIFIYLLVNSGEIERAGYIMLAIGESGTLAILIAFLLLATNAGTLSFDGIKAASSNLGVGMQWSIFILSFIGFSIKGGLLPFNFWIPRAYSVTPSAFIPLIAGATLNLGLYGIMRINVDFLPISEVGFGVVMLIIGSLTALIGILYATIEDNLKTVLAHSSIENAGIIIAAFGASIIFLVSGHKVAGAMALVASLYHMLNHSVFKTLLFMGAGTIEDESKTNSLDKLGGLLKKMPVSGFFVLIGALSISAMPPFNGFVSEWLTLESLLRSVELASIGIKITFIVSGIFLALSAGLAVTCFTRAFSMSFLGIARSNFTKNIKEVTKTTLAPMAFLALLTLLLGILPTFVIPAINKVVEPITKTSATNALVPSFFNNQTLRNKLPENFINDFSKIGAQVGKNSLNARGVVVMHTGGKSNPVVFAMSTSYMFITFIFLFGLTALLIWFFIARKKKKYIRPRWDGGINTFLPEMTYSATGFAQPVRVVFNTILHPAITEEKKTISKHFRVAIKQKRQEIHLIDRLILYPLTKLAWKLSHILAKMHNGKINTYASYAILTLLVFLSITSIF